MGVIDFPYQYQEGDINPFDVDFINPYRKSGWIHLIALPYGKQDPPPSGFTGRNAASPNMEKYKEWIRESRAGIRAHNEGDKKSGPLNVAIVHGPDTIAIDVDDYEYIDKRTRKKSRKNGGAQLRKLESELGRLPATWISSARGQPSDHGSGQRFFRLKPEHQHLAYSDKPGDSIEIVRFGHRYSVVWPSMNGRVGVRYLWWVRVNLTQGEHIWRQAERQPSKKDLPYLPDKWVEFLTHGFQEFRSVRKFEAGTFNDADIQEWLDDRAKNGMYDDINAGEGVELPPCRKMSDTLSRSIDDLPGGAHDALTKHLYAALALAQEGHSGIKEFLKNFHDAFVDEVQGRRDGGSSTAEAEWFRSFMGAFERIVAREDPPGSTCPCYRGNAPEFGGIVSDKDPADYDRSDDGNAEHMLDLANGRMRWVPEWKSWVAWMPDQQTWVPDADNVSVSYARAVGVNCQSRGTEMLQYAKAELEPGEEQDALIDKAKLLYKWGTSSRNSGRITGMIRVAQSYPDVSMSANRFDADPGIVVVGNGTLELLARRGGVTPDGEPVTLRPTSQEDYCTLTTGIDYVPWDEIRDGHSGAALLKSKHLIVDYLQVFLPDLRVRDYVQKVMGYGLFGANPERKIVFLQGPTSTGKSTLVSAVGGALGSYGSSFNLSLLREKQDDGPRVELVRSLSRRVITASEGGGEWHLHADMIKRVTGGSDKISARLNHANIMVERVPAFTPYVSCNRPPTIEAADAALWRRLIVLPFDIQVGVEGAEIGPTEAVQKSGLDSFMSTDLSCRMSWLSWLVEGYRMWVREGLGNMPEAVEGRIARFKSGVSEFHVFLDQMVQKDGKAKGNTMSIRRLYEAYEAWCWANRVQDRTKLSMINFGRKLQDNGFRVVRRYPKKSDPDYDNSRNATTYVHDVKLVGPDLEHMRPSQFNMHEFENQFDN